MLSEYLLEQYHQKLEIFSNRVFSFTSISELETASKYLLAWVKQNQIDPKATEFYIDQIKNIYQEYQYIARLIPVLSVKNLEQKYKQCKFLNQQISLSQLREIYFTQKEDLQTCLSLVGKLKENFQKHIDQIKQQEIYEKLQRETKHLPHLPYLSISQSAFDQQNQSTKNKESIYQVDDDISFKMLRCQDDQSSFELGETVVTQKLWMKIMGFNESQVKGDQNPITNLSFVDCMTFCNLLSMRLGYKPYYRMVKNTRSLVYRIYQRYLKNNPNLKEEGFRLPKIVEWQFMIKDQFLFENQDDLSDYAWLSFNSHHKIHPVKSKKANQLGFYDVYGHVWEWCSDHKYLYHTTLKRNSSYDITNSLFNRIKPIFKSKNLNQLKYLKLAIQQFTQNSKHIQTSPRSRYYHRNYMPQYQKRLECFYHLIEQEKLDQNSSWLDQPNPCLLGYSYASPMYSIFRDKASSGEIGTFDYKLDRHIFYRHPSYGLRLARTIA